MATSDTTLLTGYQPAAAAYDEMVTADGTVRPHWQQVSGALAQLGARELGDRVREIERQLEDDGVSHRPTAGATPGDAQWRLDAVPVVVPSEDWALLEAGLIQRAELLDLVVADLYGPRELLHRGVVPPEVVLGHAGFLRACDQVRLPGPSQLVNLAVDLARDGDGNVVALSDRAESPAGAGYALENRRVMARVFPSLYRSTQVHRLAPFFRALRSALHAAAPPGVSEPRIVVMSAGPDTEAAFEHALLASTLGYTLVVGEDLVAREGRVWLRTLDEREPVDVILRRVGAAWSDPLELRGDSELGVPGLIEMTRRGSVAVVNPLGAGVLENPGLQAFLPAVARALLGQDLRLPSVRTLWCGDPTQRREVEARLDELVLRPVSRWPGISHLVGADLGPDERARLLTRIAAHPYQWVGQERIDVGSTPTLVGDRLLPRRTILRTFAVAREGSFTVMPGGLARVAGDDGFVVSSSHGAASKDTWVIASEPESTTGYWLRPGPSIPVSPIGSMSARAAQHLFWLGRYAERAEGLVRLLRVLDERRTDLLSSAPGANPAGPVTVGVLLDALSVLAGGSVPPATDGGSLSESDVHTLITDPSVPGTLAWAFVHIDAAAQAVRDQLSGDVWGVLTMLDREIEAHRDSGLDDDDLAGHGRLDRILTGLLALQGMAAESMVRDPGWRFMDTGRRLERSQQLLALLRATVVDDHGTAADSLLYESVLTAAESIVTYRRRYRSRAQLATLLALLLLDPDNPRSLGYQLDQLGIDLRALPGHPGPGRVGPAERHVLDAATALRLADLDRLADDVRDGRRAELDTLLATADRSLRSAGDTIAARHFVQQRPQRSMDVGGDLSTTFEPEVERA